MAVQVKSSCQGSVFNPWRVSKDMEKRQFLLLRLISTSSNVLSLPAVWVALRECNVLHKILPLRQLGGARVVPGTDARLSHCRNCRLSGFARKKVHFQALLFTRSLRSRFRLLRFTLSGGRRYSFSDVRHRLSYRGCGSSPFGCFRLCRPACG